MSLIPMKITSLRLNHWFETAGCAHNPSALNPYPLPGHHGATHDLTRTPFLKHCRRALRAAGGGSTRSGCGRSRSCDSKGRCCSAWRSATGSWHASKAPSQPGSPSACASHPAVDSPHLGSSTYRYDIYIHTIRFCHLPASLPARQPCAANLRQ